MNANPEVMQAIAPPPTRSNPPASSAHDGRSPDGRPTRDATAANVRVSEDPMRRTDRYRLVMPWVSRV